MINIADKNQFNQEIESGVVFVDFYADWCGPCKMVSPILEELSTEMEGKVKFLKVNVDQNMEIAQEYKVVSIPTMFILHNGEKQDTLIGFSPKKTLEDKINHVVEKVGV